MQLSFELSFVDVALSSTSRCRRRRIVVNVDKVADVSGLQKSRASGKFSQLKFFK